MSSGHPPPSGGSRAFAQKLSRTSIQENPAGGSRAFAQKLSKSNASEIRRQAAQELKNDSGKAIAHRIGRSSVASISSLSALSTSSVMGAPPPPPPSVHRHADVGRQFLEPVSNRIDPSSGPGSLNESGLVEPLDYEEYITQQTRMNRGQTKHNNANDNLLVDFPPDDIEVNVVPRKIRTLGHVLPEEPIDQLDATVQNCIDAYTSDWVSVRRKYHHHSSSNRPREDLEDYLKEPLPQQEFEIDDTPDNSPDFENEDNNDGKKKRLWHKSAFMEKRKSLPNVKSLSNSRRTSMASLNSLNLNFEVNQAYLPRSHSYHEMQRDAISLCSTQYSTMDRGMSVRFAIGGDSKDTLVGASDGIQTPRARDTDAISLCSISEFDTGDITPTNSGSQESIHSAESISEENFNKRLEDALQAMSRSTRNSLQRESTKVENKTNNNKHQAKKERTGSETPRGSWASFDLRNSQPDAPIAGLLESWDADTVDSANESKRRETRPVKLFGLYPTPSEAEMIERRLMAYEPMENIKHRILVQCNKLELNLQIEPIFASMALYDAKERKKVSENFYFDMNNEPLKSMLQIHQEYSITDFTTTARSCVFDISTPSSDLFLVVKLEKVLQGDINEAAEPYLKEMNMDKVKQNAYDACNRLGRYKMPFAWTAIWLQNIIKGGRELGDSGGSDAESTASNSLDRKTSTSSFEQFRRHAAKQDSVSNSSSLTRKGSLERRDKRSSWAASSSTSMASTATLIPSEANKENDVGSMLDSFPPVTLTVSSFFKQEGDKLRDEDLYKFLQDLKRPSPVLKRLKCIRGTLKLDISVAPEPVKHCLTPELSKLIPFPDLKSRPTKEILEFSPRDVLVANYQFRNLLYICPRDLNFTNRSGERARNISVKVQFMSEDGHKGMKVIFGKSSCSEMTNEMYSAVTYHNKSPDFYEEVKVKLPSNLRDYHHILFTFYHISCQGQRKDQSSTEFPVGYTWIPICRNGSLQTGLFELPVMLDPPSIDLRRLPTDQAPSGTKWVDNKKNIFSVELIPATTVHPLDNYIDPFLQLTAKLQLGPNSYGETNIEDNLLKRINDLHRARLEPLVKFLPLILDKLLLLMVKPPTFDGHILNVASAAFNSISMIVNKLTSSVELMSKNDRHGRNELLMEYIQYQAHLPHPDLRQDQMFKTGTVDDEVGNIMRNGEVKAKLVHEQLAFQWLGTCGVLRENALKAGWFFLELMIKAMIEHLATRDLLNANRKHRFSEQFHDDVVNLTASVTNDIVNRRNDSKLVENLNSSLAFFLHDLLSVMDRGFVFSLIRSYSKDITAKVSSIPDSVNMWSLQLDFTRIVCSHEHYVALNLPSKDPAAASVTFDLYSGASSPTPSVRSNDSQSSFISHLTEKSHWAELTPEFKRRHFLVGLVLSQLSNAFDHTSPEVHMKAVNSIRCLLTSHDVDIRYHEPDLRSRVANLYLPLVAIIIDNLPKLFSWSIEGEVRIVGNSNANEHLNMILNVISDNLPNPKGPVVLKESTTRHLLICFLWVLKNVDKAILKQWWIELPHNRLQTLLEVLRITLSCFQYKREKHRRLHGASRFASEPCLWFRNTLPRSPSDNTGVLSESHPDLELFNQYPSLEQGRKAIRKHLQLGNRKSLDMRSQLGEMISGIGSNRQEMLRNRSKAAPPSPNPDNNRKWHKTSFLRNNQLATGDSLSLLGVDAASANSTIVSLRNQGVDYETATHMEGNLATEASMLVLDTLDLIVQIVSHTDHSQGLLASVLRVLLHALGTNQSTMFLQHLFAVQRSFVFKFPSLLFDEASEHCADLCLRLLKHCSSSISPVRSQSSASLYLLMRQNFEIGNNFARVKMQVTMSLSSLVGTMENFNEEYLRKSLKTILVYAEQDHELAETSFPEQVQDLVFNLHMILSDTVKMKEYQDDPEMHMDLMYRIAKGYQNSPDLRLTWLESMAKKHIEYEHFAEAAMCKIHCAALVAEYLHMLEDRQYMPLGAVSFQNLTPNAVEESAVSDDVVSPDEEGICTGKNFTEPGLMQFLDEAAKLFNRAIMYEAVNEVYKISIPIAEFQRNFKKLTDIHKDLFDAFTNIDRLQGKRIFGTYFRVGFYGSRFGDLDNEEYIYKEKVLAKLPEIAHRLEHFYCDKYGKDNVVIIKDSKLVEQSKLDPQKAYVQITYVEPYFDEFELRDRKTPFEQNFKLMRFIFATPFTPDGKPHGELHEQYKRKTILTTSNHFPYVKTRIKVEDRKQIVLTPIEVAIEDVQKKIAELDAAIHQVPPDPKILQMVLQGCIGTTVNQGPSEVANVFLKDLFDGKKSATKHQNKLRVCFKDFTRLCGDALKRNKKLITPDQKEYQHELEKNYQKFEAHLSPLFSLNPTRPQTSSPQSQEKVTSPMV